MKTMKVSPLKPLKYQTGRVKRLTIVRILQPVVYCLKLFGIYIRDEELTTLERFYGYLVLIIVNVHFGALACHAASQIYIGSDANRSSLVNVMSNAIVQVAVYDVLFWRRRSVARMLLMLQDIQRVSARHSVRTYALVKHYMTAEVLVVLVRRVGAVIYYATNHFLYNEDIFPTLFVEQSSYRAFEIQLLNVWFIEGLFFFAFFTLYMVVCIVLSSSLGSISRTKMTSHDWTRSSTSPIEYHSHICDGVAETNSVFSELLFVNSACQLAAILFYMREMNLHLAKVNVNIENVTFLVDTLVRFAASNMFASKVNSRILTSLTEFNDADILARGELYNNKSGIIAKVLLYKRRIILEPPGLTGWNMYTPSKTTIVVAASNILTYVLVLYRLVKPPDEEDFLFNNSTNATLNETTIPPTLTTLMLP